MAAQAGTYWEEKTQLIERNSDEINFDYIEDEDGNGTVSTDGNSAELVDFGRSEDNDEDDDVDKNEEDDEELNLNEVLEIIDLDYFTELYHQVHHTMVSFVTNRPLYFFYKTNTNITCYWQ